MNGKYEGPIRSYGGYGYGKNVTVDYSLCSASKWLFARCPGM